MLALIIQIPDHHIRISFPRCDPALYARTVRTTFHNKTPCSTQPPRLQYRFPLVILYLPEYIHQ